MILCLYLAAALRPEGTLVSLDVTVGLLPVIFALWHLTCWAGASTAIGSFVVIVATDRVFGNYYYPPDVLGPLLVSVPPLIMLQYFAMGYSALLKAHAISGTLSTRTTEIRLVATAALAALTMVVLDLSSDPMQSTVLGD